MQLPHIDKKATRNSVTPVGGGAYLLLYYPHPRHHVVTHGTWHLFCGSCQFTARIILPPQTYTMEPLQLAGGTSPDRDIAHPASSNPSLEARTNLKLSEPRRHQNIQDQGIQDQHLRHDGVKNPEHETTTEKADTTRPTDFWCPFWLQRRVLSSFLGVFVSFAVTLIVLSVCSHRNDGLGEARTGFSYLWRFGPTARM